MGCGVAPPHARIVPPTCTTGYPDSRDGGEADGHRACSPPTAGDSVDINAWWVGAGGLALVLVLVFGAWLVTVIVRRSNDRATEDTAPFDVKPSAEPPEEPAQDPEPAQGPEPAQEPESAQEPPEEPPAG